MNSSFYIVATSPLSAAWSYTDSLTETLLCPFVYKNRHISSVDGLHFLAVNESDGTVYFSDSEGGAADIELENDTVATNFKIKFCGGGGYISHRDGRLCYNNSGVSARVTPSNTWIFMPTEINPNITFVVARYNENPSWVRLLPGRVIIYNKGKDDICEFERRDNITVEPVENVGREGHTYLHYMITQYDSLADRAFFLQADPFDHAQNVLELCCMAEDLAPFQGLSTWYIKDKVPNKYIAEKYMKLVNGAASMLYIIDKQGHHLEYNDPCWAKNSEIYARDASPLTTFLERAGMTHKIREHYKYGLGALFSATRDIILLNSRADYQRVSDELIRQNKQGGHEGYILEKLWWGLLTNDSVDLIRDMNTQIYYVARLNSGAYKTNLMPLSNGFIYTEFPRYVFADDEPRNSIKAYSSLLKRYMEGNFADMFTVINYDCAFNEEVGARFMSYYNYLAQTVGAWDIFLGAPKNFTPVRIVSAEPYIIECSRAESLTFAIHSRAGAERVADALSQAWSQIVMGGDGEIESVDKIVADAAGNKIWIPYPVLAGPYDDPEYCSRTNAILEAFISNASAAAVGV
jgi:hypothetical protein